MSIQNIHDRLMVGIRNEVGVCCLMGSMRAESGMNSINLQNSYNKKLNISDEDYTAVVDAGGYDNGFITDKAGYGLIQWTFWSRKQMLLKYARKLDVSIGDENMQVDFTLYELATNYKTVFDALKNATFETIDEVSDLVTTKYEAPADQSEAKKQERRDYAREFYQQFKEVPNMGYTNSPLVDCERLSPNHSGERTHKIDRITPHCVVGQLSAERIGDCFPNGRNASANYGVGYDGRQCLIVPEAYRSWCTSSSANDQRAITIEVASDMTDPYAFTNEAYAGLLELCIDICKRNGLNKVIWFGDKDKSLNYEPADGECVLTAHRWFVNKSCPGDWMYERMGQLADDINKALGNYGGANVEIKVPNDGITLYRVQCGAYRVKENADRQLAVIKAKGIDAFVTQVGDLYKVQVGAYGVKSNAEAQLNRMQSIGFDCFITTVTRESESFVPRKSAEEIAEEIWTGKCSDSRWDEWGSGDTRRERLEAAGYDYDAVQAAIKKLYG